MHGLSKSERVRDLFDNKLGKISEADIRKICPDISVATIEKTLTKLVKEDYIIKVGSGRATAYIKNNN